MENPQDDAARAKLALFTARAQAFVQPETESTHRTPPMPPPMVLLINALIFVRHLESTWPRPGDRHLFRYLARIIKRQSQLLNFLVSLPFRRYCDQLARLDQLSDRQMEELRWFCLLLHELEGARGKKSPDGEHTRAEYAERAAARAMRLSEGMYEFARMTLDYLVEKAAGVGQAVQAELPTV